MQSKYTDADRQAILTYAIDHGGDGGELDAGITALAVALGAETPVMSEVMAMPEDHRHIFMAQRAAIERVAQPIGHVVGHAGLRAMAEGATIDQAIEYERGE